MSCEINKAISLECAKPVIGLKPQNNDGCPCGSGKKYKKCCRNK